MDNLIAWVVLAAIFGAYGMCVVTGLISKETLDEANGVEKTILRR